VADANSDALSLVDVSANRETGRLSVRPYRNAPPGASPQGLAVNGDGSRLYVADAGSDEVSVVQLAGGQEDRAAALASGNGDNGDISDNGDNGGAGRVLGRIPTAWYPTSVTLSKDGAQLFITNAKGNGAGPNDSGYYPDPTRKGGSGQRGGYADRYCGCT